MKVKVHVILQVLFDIMLRQGYLMLLCCTPIETYCIWCDVRNFYNDKRQDLQAWYACAFHNKTDNLQIRMGHLRNEPQNDRPLQCVQATNVVSKS